MEFSETLEPEIIIASFQLMLNPDLIKKLKDMPNEQSNKYLNKIIEILN